MKKFISMQCFWGLQGHTWFIKLISFDTAGAGAHFLIQSNSQASRPRSRKGNKQEQKRTWKKATKKDIKRQQTRAKKGNKQTNVHTRVLRANPRQEKGTILKGFLERGERISSQSGPPWTEMTIIKMVKKYVFKIVANCAHLLSCNGELNLKKLIHICFCECNVLVYFLVAKCEFMIWNLNSRFNILIQDVKFKI